ncbi:MAG: Nif3-like dinuclear metal center hexameric protein [Pseudomonadota bacterium]
MPVRLIDLVTYCDDYLEASAFQDYCPNGLQVEAGERVTRLASAVTASLAVIQEARAWGADLLLVHHGYFWRGEPASLVGIKGRRIAALIRASLNLVAYHLPLDAHLIVGNNRQLADRLGLLAAAPVPGSQGLLWQGRWERPLAAEAVAADIAAALKRSPLHLPGTTRPITTLAWSSGAAQDSLIQAARLGVDAFLTGEVSERSYHEARELEIHVFGAGHHATECFGVQALGGHLAAKYGLDHRFIDQPNPV